MTIGNYKTNITVVGGIGLINENLLLDVGDYEAVIAFAGDNNHNPVVNNTEFHIHKANATLYVVALDTVYPNIVFAAVWTDCNDTVKIYLNDEFKFSIPVDELVIFDLGILSVGKYNITAVFDGNNHYNAVSNTSSFNVTQGNVNFTINTNKGSFLYNESVVISHNLTDGATGTIQYYLYDGTLLGEADVSENFTLPVFDCGEYVIVGNYSGDAVYNSAMGMLNINITKAPNNVFVNVEDVNYGRLSVVNVHADVDGLYVVNINGKSVNVNVVGGEGFNSIELDAGNYTTKTVFYNKNYDTVISESTFEVKKANIDLNITIENVYYPNAVEGVVHASVDGKYDVRIGNVIRTVNVKDGVGRFNMGIFDAGDYDASVIFNGTSNYNKNANYTEFRVNKAEISLIVNVNDCVYLDDVVVDVHASIDGEYRLIVGSVNTTFEVINNEASVNVGKLNHGDYEVYVLFEGNRNYNNNSNSTNFTVDKAKSNITIDINGTEFVYGKHITVTHNLTEDALGYITYFLGDGSEIAQTSVDADYILPILDVGEYWIIALYEGDGNYYPAVDLVKFSIVPAANIAVVNVSDVTYGTSSIIQIQADVDGNYTLDVNGSRYNVPVMNGIGSYSLNLDAGFYYANVTFNNTNYNTEYRNAEFWVNKALNNVVVNVSDVMYGYHSLIEVSADVDGVYAVEINGTVYNVTVRDNFGSKSILLDVGNYTTSTVFFDKNYDNVISEAAFEVYKVDIPYVFFFVENSTYGEPVVIYMVSPVNGVYNVRLNDVWFDVEVIDHFGVYYIDVLDAGDYVLFTSCVGDEHFNPTNASEYFTVFKANSTVTVDPASASVDMGGSVVITVATVNATGFDAKLYSGATEVTDAVNITGDNVTVSAAVLSPGAYTLKVTTIVDANHSAVTKDVSIVVNDPTPPVLLPSRVTVPYSSSADYGTAVIIRASDLVNAYGIGAILLDSNGAKISDLRVSGLNIYVDTADLDVGAYEILVYTLVDTSKYTSYSTSCKLIVNRGNAVVNVVIGDVEYGKPIDVSVDVLGGTGKVIVSVAGVPKTTSLVNGSARFTFDAITAPGKYDVYVAYFWDDKYNDFETTESIEVVAPSVIIADNIKRGVNSPYDYYATLLDADGKPIAGREITFIIDGKTLKATTDAEGIARVSANLTLVNGTDTVYNVVVTNPDTLENVTATTTIVPRIVVVSGDLSGDYLSNSPYVVQAIGDDGNPVGEGETVNVVFAGFGYDLKTNATGHVVRTIGLAPGMYAVKACYKGYNTTATVFVVKQILKVTSGILKKTAKSYTLKATLKHSNGKAIAGKVVKLTFNGKSHKVTTNSKGVASYKIGSKIIKKLKAGKTYTLQARYVNDIAKGKIKVEK